MSAFSWLRRLGQSTCPSESSAPAGCRFGADRAASAFDSLRVGRGLLPILLGLYALFGFVAPAAAQTAPTANDDGSYSVPYDWALKPSGISGGERFRLIFITSTTRDMSATGIGTYNTFVQGRAAAGHTAIRPYSSTFRVLGSTSTVDARDNTSTRGSRGVPIYWLNGPKVADTYADFYDGSWDNQRADLNRNESGTAQQANNVGTGSNGDGTKHTSNHFGEASVQMGQPHSSRDPVSYNAGTSNTLVRFYGLSPVFVVTPPPDVSVHASDAIGREGINNSAAVELRLARALESGETLTVDYSIDIDLDAVNESHNGVSATRTVVGGVTSGTVTITGPNAPQNITLRLRPAANSVNRLNSAVKTAEFKLTGVSGVAGAEAVAGADSTKVFVNDSAVSRYTYMNVSGGSTNATTTTGTATVRLDGSIVEEGGKVLILLHGKAGRKQNTGRPYAWYNVTVGVQHLTTDFDDLGEAHRGHDAFVGFLRRDEAAKTDYYNVGVLGMGFSAEMWIPIKTDLTNEGDEHFRVFIAETPDYMGVEGAYNATNDRAPAVEFTIRNQYVTPPQSVPDNWALKPSGLGAGDYFRLLFLTGSRNASASDIATYNTFVQTQAASGHTAIQSYSSQFRMVGSTASVSARDNTETTGAGDGVPIYWLNGDKIADDYDDFWDGSWDAQMSSDTRGADGMAVSGALRVWTGARTDGGIHSNPLGSGTVRYGEWGASTNPVSSGTDLGSGGRRMLALSPVFEVLSGMRLQAAPPPSQAVSNVQVAAVDAANARVTWNAVPHATSYQVVYETTSTLVDEDNYVQGVALDWTDTEWTFQHDAAETMTLTVTVTPAYEDEYGDTQVLDNLAGAATIDVAPPVGGDSIRSGGSTDNVEDDGGAGATPEQPDYSALKAKIQGYADEQDSDSDHAQRWKRALAALGDQDAIDGGYQAMTASEAQGYADRGWSRWDEVVDALTELESRETTEPEPEPEPEPDPIPELSLSGGSAVDEGASASFTVHADPAPASGVTVSVTVSQSGDYLDLPGAGTRTITLATGAATASLTVATVNDGTDEPDGSVSVRIDGGTGYTVASSNHTASVTVRDNDDPPPARTIGACVSLSQWKTVKGYYDSNAYRSPNYGANWYRVLIAYHEDRGDQTMPDWVGATSKPSSAYTVEEAERSETVWSGWTPVRKVLQCLEKESGQSFAPLLPSSSNSAHEGVVRFVNASPQGGSVHIQATDDSGWSPPPVTLQVGPGESVHLTTGDLEQGNAAKGLSGYLGAATGDWRLDVSSERDIEVLPYVRAHDGVLAPMHAVAEAERGVHRVSTFAPANDPGAPGRTGLLRLVNRGDEALTARIAGTDDSGAPGGEVSLDIPAREAVLLTAAELEGGASGLRGALGDGRGMWRLSIASDGDLAAMSLLRSGGGHLTNLSGGASPAARSSEVHAVPYFPSASDPLGRQGLVRIVNDTASRAMVRVQPHDDAGRRYEPLTLALGAGEAAHLNSWDLETGNASGGLSGRTGSGTGDWRLDIAGPPGVEVLAYVRAPTGSLMPVHDVADAAELETGQGIGGALGDGAGHWRLDVESGRPVFLLNLAEPPAGQIVNLSSGAR